jgi:hypothetical protein
MSTTGPDKSEPPPKRSRLEDVAEEKAELTSNDDTCSVLDNVVDSRVLSNVGQYLETYQDAKPYRHGLIEGICVDGFLGGFDVVFLLLSLHHGTRQYLHASFQILFLTCFVHTIFLFIYYAI